MKGRLTLQQRLVIPIILLGLVAFLSNVLAVFSINNVHANAGTIVDEYMVSEGKLEEIRRSLMDIHRLALSHIVAADHATMIRLVQEIKAEEAALDEQLSDYAPFASGADEEVYPEKQLAVWTAIRCTSEHILDYIELDGDPSDNLEAFESVIRYMKDCGMGYGSVNHPVDRDPVCGYNGIIEDVCPKCGRSEDAHNQPFERIRRITGYLVGTLDRFNDAKRAEESQRVKHEVPAAE